MSGFRSDYGEWRISAGKRASAYTVTYFDGIRWVRVARFRSGADAAFVRCLRAGAPVALAEEAASLLPL